MVDLVLALVFGGLGQGGWSREPRDPAEHAVAAIGLVALPAVAFCIVLFANILEPLLALVALPLTSLLIVIGACKALHLTGGFALRIAAATVFTSFVACATAWLLTGFIALFRAF